MTVEFIQQYMNLIYAAGAILLLLLLALILIRLFGGGVRGRRGSRLGISEYYEIDKSRRLVLVRRDDMEHLLLIGGNQDVVVETDIGSPLAGSQSSRPPPRPAVFGPNRRPSRPVEATAVREEPEM
jgi:hypothetical protein